MVITVWMQFVESISGERMKVSGINAAMAHKIEMQKLVHQETIKQQQIKVIKDRKEEIERMRPQDLNKGQNIDEMA